MTANDVLMTIAASIAVKEVDRSDFNMPQDYYAAVLECFKTCYISLHENNLKHFEDSLRVIDD